MKPKSSRKSVNPLYDAWKRCGLRKNIGLSLWDLPMPCSAVLDKPGAMTRHFLKRGGVHVLREKLTRQYSWAVPSREAIRWIASRCQLIVEIGAGRGYWANLLVKAGVDVVAYDCAIDQEGEMISNGHHYDQKKGESNNLFFPVQNGWPPYAARHTDRTLMLCWPPYETNMAAMALKHYCGDRVLYIGEFHGCNADDSFFEMLDNEWQEIGECEIPTWPGIRDRICLFERKGMTKRAKRGTMGKPA